MFFTIKYEWKQSFSSLHQNEYNNKLNYIVQIKANNYHKGELILVNPMILKFTILNLL